MNSHPMEPQPIPVLSHPRQSGPHLQDQHPTVKLESTYTLESEDPEVEEHYAQPLASPLV